ncbi:hypothetical protein [Dactylosporangium cerinum]
MTTNESKVTIIAASAVTATAHRCAAVNVGDVLFGGILPSVFVGGTCDSEAWSMPSGVATSAAAGRRGVGGVESLLEGHGHAFPGWLGEGGKP